MHLFSPPVSILGTRYKTVLFRKLADAFLMMYQTAAVELFTNNGAFGGFCHGNPVSIERVHLDDFGMEKARKRRILGVCGLLDRWQGQKDLNPRHAVLEAMLNFLSRSIFSPILGICCQTRSCWWKNWCFFDDVVDYPVSLNAQFLHRINQRKDISLSLLVILELQAMFVIQAMS